ncbi:hypothetical protein F1880_004690 [Penicillium rolfsii]|nr:hypothetical protein F1880_004690 [Penicillium rolfsii]
MSGHIHRIIDEKWHQWQRHKLNAAAKTCKTCKTDACCAYVVPEVEIPMDYAKLGQSPRRSQKHPAPPIPTGAVIVPALASALGKWALIALRWSLSVGPGSSV